MKIIAFLTWLRFEIRNVNNGNALIIIYGIFFAKMYIYSATTESTTKASSSAKSIIIGRHSTTTPAQTEEEEEEVCFFSFVFFLNDETSFFTTEDRFHFFFNFLFRTNMMKTKMMKHQQKVKRKHRSIQKSNKHLMKKILK